MFEVWLRPNVRILLLALPPAVAIAALGGLALSLAEGVAWHAIAWGLLGLGLWFAVGVAMQLRRPRIAFADQKVLFYLRARRPIAVPVEAVEAFFLGQGPAHLPGKSQHRAESIDLVARLSQKYPEWEKIEVKRVLGRWCDSYVTLCGSWCEPLNTDVVQRLNRRLREAREQAEQTLE
ncbi:MAG: hypothetical protein AAF961_11205 [Planctomycetota bacterium]